MSEVWKYPLEIKDAQTIPMPTDADLLFVAIQHEQLCLWARVIPTSETVSREILIRGTGHPIWQQPYIGSVVTTGGTFVWHVFDGGEPE